MTEGQLRVLLVDDERSLREPLQQFLKANFGYDVDAVPDGRTALAQVQERQGRYDVALIDELLVNGPDGIQVMQQIKSHYPAIEVIVFTGWGPKSRERALQAGAFRYLEKPLDLDELALTIRTAAQQVRLREISRDILSELDRDQVLTGIVRAACSLALADDASIVLLDRVTGRLRIHARTRPEEPAWARHFLGQALSRDIVRLGEGVQVYDTTADLRVNPQIVLAGIRSFVALPIPGEAGNLGVLYVYSRRPGRFEEWGSVGLLHTLAGQAGVALVNAEAFEQVQAQARFMEALVRAGHGLTRATNAHEQLELAWAFVRQQLRVSTFYVALYDRQTDRLTFPLFYDRDQPVQVEGSTLGEDPTRWGITGCVVKRGEEWYSPTWQHARIACQAAGIQAGRVGERSESCFCFPLQVAGEVIGAVSIQSYEPNAFSVILLDACRALGTQLAVSLENARLLTQLERTREAARLIAGVTLQEELRETLAATARHTRQILCADSVVIYAYEEEKRAFGEWAADTIQARTPDSNCPSEQLGPDSVPNRIVALEEPPYYYLAEDGVSEDRLLGGRFALAEGIRSGLGIQLRVRGHKVGVMFVNYRSRHHFSADEVVTVQLFADQAAVAIRNAQQYDELRRAQGLVGTRTALAWMGMASSAWRHAIDKHALTIRELAQLMLHDWEQNVERPRDTLLQQRLQTIARLASQILDKPITPPLSTEAGREAVSLSTLIGERARQLWKNDPYRAATLTLDLRLPEEVTVLVSPEWLRRAFDVLVDNALDAVAGLERREVRIGTRLSRCGAEIWVADTGTGIPENIRARIGLEYIQKPEEARGLGMGLLMAHTIVQTYGGEIRVASTGPEGTTMVIGLPTDFPDVADPLGLAEDPKP